MTNGVGGCVPCGLGQNGGPRAWGMPLQQLQRGFRGVGQHRVQPAWGVPLRQMRRGYRGMGQTEENERKRAMMATVWIGAGVLGLVAVLWMARREAA